MFQSYRTKNSKAQFKNEYQAEIWSDILSISSSSPIRPWFDKPCPTYKSVAVNIRKNEANYATSKNKKMLGAICITSNFTNVLEIHAGFYLTNNFCNLPIVTLSRAGSLTLPLPSTAHTPIKYSSSANKKKPSVVLSTENCTKA